jgi:IS5 family transposase
MDATVAPQNVTFPTDLKVLNSAREKSEKIIDKLYNKEKHETEKPRTYTEWTLCLVQFYVIFFLK